MKSVLSKPILLVFICFLFTQCKKEQKNTTEKSVDIVKTDTIPEKVFDSSKQVLITGKSKDLKALRYFNLLNYSYLVSTNQKQTQDKLQGDSLSIYIPQLEKAQLMEIMTFGNPFFDSKVYVTPGDTIRFILKDGQMVFTGKNAAQYNLYPELDKLHLVYPNYKNDIKRFKTEVEKVYQQRLAFVENYFKKHPEVTEAFKKEVRGEVRFRYLYNLVSPRAIQSLCSSNAKMYFNTSDGIFSVLRDDVNQQEKLFDATTYFDNVTIQDFERADLINNDYFKRSLTDYVRFYFSNQEFIDYSYENFEKEKNYIESHLQDTLKIFAISRMIRDYYAKGFARSKRNINALQSVIKTYSPKGLNPSYSKTLDSINDILKNFNTKLPDYVLEEKLLTLKQDTVTLSQILHKNNTLKVINFWSYSNGVTPSKFKKEKHFRENIKSKENLTWVYFCVNTNQKNWETQSNNLKNVLVGKEQYRLLDIKKSKLLKYLRVSATPKYTIINNQDILLMDDAPQPIDSTKFENVIKEFNHH
ncbi:hypothetical protein ACG2LH_02270 [Zhouia sp. PK063]|uniref:hypothetical protein n=1 Tax=Zhouia sp. PK063 TaxID=3373602 RepID=UPI0037A02BAC